MNVFIVFVKFLGRIVASWARLAGLSRLIGEEEGPTTKMKNIISKKKKKNWARGAQAPFPLSPHHPSPHGPSLVKLSIKRFDLFIKFQFEYESN